MEKKVGKQQGLSNLGINFDEKPLWSILLCGEGDFSYTLSFLQLLKNLDVLHRVKILATSIDTKKEVLCKYSRANEILSELEEENGIVLSYGVDARFLSSNKLVLHFLESGKIDGFDRIVFNFPHLCGKSNIGGNRKLLFKFFESACTILREWKSQVWVTLVEGQGGTTRDSLKREYGNTWQIQKLAAHSRFLLLDVLDATKALEELRNAREDNLNYSNVGFRNRNQTFLWKKRALSHLFVLENRMHRSCVPMTWKFDIAYTINEGRFCNQLLHETISTIAGEGIKVDEECVLDVYQREGCVTLDRTSRFVFTSYTKTWLRYKDPMEFISEVKSVLENIALMSLEDDESKNLEKRYNS